MVWFTTGSVLSREGNAVKQIGAINISSDTEIRMHENVNSRTINWATCYTDFLGQISATTYTTQLRDVL